jgi:8-oxo-dGTP pyrophosphatase MutT (NUDIX family)
MKDHAAIMIRDNDGRILFIQRSMKKSTLPGAWSFPSGTVEEGEDVLLTAVRESMEELGIDVSPERVLSTLDLPEFSARLHFVLCLIGEGEPSITEPDEIDAIEWMSMADFFEKFSDDEIGHGLIWLRKNPDIWAELGIDNLK